MYDPDQDDVGKFHISFLNSLKKDLVTIQEFTRECHMRTDEGPQKIQNMSTDQQDYYNNKTSCDLCGKRFGSSFFCKDTQKWVTVVKNPGLFFGQQPRRRRWPMNSQLALRLTQLALSPSQLALSPPS